MLITSNLETRQRLLRVKVIVSEDVSLGYIKIVFVDVLMIMIKITIQRMTMTHCQ